MAIGLGLECRRRVIRRGGIIRGVARRVEDLPERRLLVADETSGWTDDAVAESFTSWLAEFDAGVTVEVAVSAADTLAEARAAGEV